MMKFVTLVAPCALIFSTTAQAACPPPAVITATKINILDVMLMVSSLRCRLTGVDFRGQYQRFREVRHAELAQAALTLQQEMGANAYDRFVTWVANQYGGGVPGMGCVELAQMTGYASQENLRGDDLVDLADQSGISQMFGEERCAQVARR